MRSHGWGVVGGTLWLMGCSLAGPETHDANDPFERGQASGAQTLSPGVSSLDASSESLTEEQLGRDQVFNGIAYRHLGKVTRFAQEGEYEANERKWQERERREQETGVSSSSFIGQETRDERRARLADEMRGVLLFRGHEYIQRDPAWNIADAILQSEEQEDLRLPAIDPDAEPLTEEVAAAPEAELDDSLAMVHGTDDRVLRRDNTSYPMRTQMLFTVGEPGSGETCSGTMIGPGTMLTAAHCVHTGTAWIGGAWRVAAGVDSQDSIQRPYGTSGGLFPCMLGRISAGYAGGNTSSEHDYAVVDISACPHPGSTVGWLGVWAAGDSQLDGSTMFLYGYPGKNTDCPGGCKYPSVWGIGNSTNAGARDPHTIQYDTDATGGQSGSAVYISFGGRRYVVGIHKGSTWGLWDGYYNHGRRVSAWFLSFIEANSPWRRASDFPGGYPSH